VLNRDKPDVPAAVLQPHGGLGRRERARAGLRPFDEHDGVLEVRLEVPPLRRRHVAEAEQVEVGDVDAAVVAVADREGGARHGARHAERTAGAADERRLPGAELAGDGDDVAGCQLGRKLRGELLRLGGRATLGQKRPSWTAGSAVTGVRKTGSGGGSISRPSSSGSRAKSDLSTSSMRGV
jgi:hypothetical protein